MSLNRTVMEKILLHCCCAPCSAPIMEWKISPKEEHAACNILKCGWKQQFSLLPRKASPGLLLHWLDRDGRVSRKSLKPAIGQLRWSIMFSSGRRTGRKADSQSTGRYCFRRTASITNCIVVVSFVSGRNLGVTPFCILIYFL